MSEWLTEDRIAELENEIDADEGLASLTEMEGTMTLEAYLESRNASDTSFG